MTLLLQHINWVEIVENGQSAITPISIRIRNGQVEETGMSLVAKPDEEEIDCSGYFGCNGWVDMWAQMGAPGRPENESIESFFNAAAAGGFTHVQINPAATPLIQSRETVAYFKQIKSHNGVQLLVSGGATNHLAGEKFTEILRMTKEGVSSFSNVESLRNNGVLSQLLIYLTHSQLPFFEVPLDADLAKGGQIHEGEVADRRGLQGIPRVAEELVVDRNLSLLKWTHANMHFCQVTLPESVEKIHRAQIENLQVSCSISPDYLAFTHENLDQFDTRFKVWPPFRESTDRDGLKALVKDGKIDALVSGHKPWHYDFKDIEFEEAEFGISSLETCFAAAVTYGELTEAAQIAALLSSGPRRILKLPNPMLKPGIPSDFTLFSMDEHWCPLPANWQSKSKNNPYLHTKLKGRVVGIITPNGFFANPHPKI